MNPLAAVFDLNHPAHVVHWHFIQLSVPNIVVIGVMFAVFAIAIALPFPGAARRARARAGQPQEGSPSSQEGSPS
jgi:hypothetical protein